MTKSKLVYRPTAVIKKKYCGAEWAMPGSLTFKAYDLL